MDLLIALIDRAPHVVSKAELEALVWPKMFVEESSLRVQIGALRKVLGDGVGGARFIANVPGRGYAFVAPLQPVACAPAPQQHAAAIDLADAALAPAVKLPVRLTTMIGRAANQRAVSTLLAQGRLVTITGPGGVGKTTLAIAVAESVAGEGRCAATFVDLSLVSAAEHLPSHVGAALAIKLNERTGPEALAARLKGREGLLLLDNCEHLLDPVASLVVHLLRAAPGLRVLCTSHESLTVQGERVHRLEPLPVPTRGVALDAATALQYPAVALLVERTAADSVDFEFTDADAPLATELCHRLDGLPLAIEMAAAGINIFGLRDLASRLDERLPFLSGDRTTHARHQTLFALHEWSYLHLPAREQSLLRRLAAFCGPFTMSDAARVAPDEPRLVEAVSGLVSRSLLVPDFNGQEARYRMLMTTRHFARDKLSDCHERDEVRARHVAWVAHRLEAVNAEWVGADRVFWTEQNAPLFDEVLWGIDWAFGPHGDSVRGAELTLLAMHLSHQLSAHAHFQAHLTTALGRVGRDHPLLEMRLCVALGVARALSGAPLADIEPSHQRALAAAERLGSGWHDAETPYGVFLGALIGGVYPQAEVHARRILSVSLAHADSSGALIGQRMLAQALRELGRHRAARDLVEQVLRDDRRLARLGGYWIDPVDRQVSMRTVLARLLWLQGEPGRALATVREALALAEREGGTAQAQVIATAAIPLACWAGERAWALALNEELTHITSRQGLGFWARWACAFHAALAGEPVPLVRPIDDWLSDVLGSLAQQCVDAATVARVEAGLVGWCGPEVLRAWGDRLLSEQAQGEARGCYERALTMARQQGALAWELRSAISLARLLWHQGEAAWAARTLADVRSRYPSHARTPDLDAAAELLEQLKGRASPAGRGLHEHRPYRNLQ